VVTLKVLAAFEKAPSGMAIDEAVWEEKEDDGELGFDKTMKRNRVRVHLWPRYHQANALRTFAASTVLSRRRIWEQIELGSRTAGGEGEARQ